MSSNHISSDNSNTPKLSLKLVGLYCGLFVSVLMLIGLFYRSEIFDYLKIEPGLLQILVSIVMWVFGVLGAFIVLVIAVALIVFAINLLGRRKDVKLRPGYSYPKDSYPSDSSSEGEQGTDCPACNGTGRILMTNNGYYRGTMGSEYETCDQCNGTGKR